MVPTGHTDRKMRRGAAGEGTGHAGAHTGLEPPECCLPRSAALTSPRSRHWTHGADTHSPLQGSEQLQKNPVEERACADLSTTPPRGGEPVGEQSIATASPPDEPADVQLGLTLPERL